VLFSSKHNVDGGLWTTWVEHKLPSVLQSPLPTSLLSNTYDSSTMERVQPFQRTPHVDNRRVTEGGTITSDSIVHSAPGIVGGSVPQQRVPHWPTTSPMPEPSSSWPPGNSYTHSIGTENEEVERYSVSHSSPQSLKIADSLCLRDLHCIPPSHQRLIDTHTIPQSRYMARVMCQMVDENSTAMLPKRLVA